MGTRRTEVPEEVNRTERPPFISHGFCPIGTVILHGVSIIVVGKTGDVLFSM